MSDVRIRRPTTSGSRGMSFVPYSKLLTKRKPTKSLLAPRKQRAGRDALGTISVRHRGGGNKRHYRLLRSLDHWLGEPGTVQSIEYDPNRSAFIALVTFASGQKTYLLAPHDLQVGHTVQATRTKPVLAPGNRATLAVLPTGIELHDLELVPNQGGKLARGAGTALSIVAHEDDGRYAQVRLPSGEIRRVLSSCFASIGRVGNLHHNAVRIGKAGRVRHLGRRPTVRGKAMNPDDHPHGGGEGVNPIGLTHPKTRWGKHALGVRTRRYKRSNRMIIRSRHRK